MTIRENPTPNEWVSAQALYDAILMLQPTEANPISTWELATETGIDQRYISGLMQWAQRKMAPADGNHIGSRRGYGGGYYLTVDAEETRTSLIREYRQQVNMHLRVKGMTEAGAGFYDPVTARRLRHSANESLTVLREALVDLGADPGNIVV